MRYFKPSEDRKRLARKFTGSLHGLLPRGGTMRGKTSNIEHRTSNIQLRRPAPRNLSAFEVRGSRFELKARVAKSKPSLSNRLAGPASMRLAKYKPGWRTPLRTLIHPSRLQVTSSRLQVCCRGPD